MPPSWGIFFIFYENRILMKTTQIIFIFMLFILAMIVLTLPVWIDRALPIMKNGIISAGKTFEDMQASLAVHLGKAFSGYCEAAG